MEARAQESLQDLVRESQLVFRGTIRKIGAATMPEVRADDLTAVVTVEEVLHAPPALGDFKGKDITVQLVKPIQPGQSVILFTASWLYGQSIAVREVGRLSTIDTAQAESAGVRARIVEAQKQLAEAALQRRIENAEVVVVGRVTSTGPLEPRRPLRSEHDPIWWKASIAVESVEKGTLDGSSVEVLFPSSMDVMWQRSPKFKAGQEGIWILDRDEAKELGVDGLTALEPLDFQPREQLERIRRLTRGAQQRPPAGGEESL